MLYLCADPGVPIGGTKGASIHVFEFLSGLRRAGLDATVVAAASMPESQHMLPFDLHIPQVSGLQAFYRAGRQTPASRRAKREARTFAMNTWFEQKLTELLDLDQFDVLYERYSLFGIAGTVTANRFGIPHILEVNAPLVREAAEHRELESRDLARSVEDFVFHHSNQIICVSDALKQYVENIAPGRSACVVPNGVNTHRRSTDPRIATDSMAESAFVVGFVGAVKPWHGVEHLLNIVPELIRRDPRIRIRIVGSQGGLGEKLAESCRERGLTNHVEFVGAVPYDTVPAELASMDVVVAPYPELSDFYFSPLKVFEYMAAGRAIVASEIGQIRDILKHEETGLLVPPGDEQALLAAILRLRKDPGLRRRLGEAARREAYSKHSWDTRIADILMLSRKLKPQKFSAKAETQ